MKTRSGATLRQALDRLVAKEELQEAGLTAVGGMDIVTAQRILDSALYGTADDYIGRHSQPEEPKEPPLLLGRSIIRRKPRRKENRNDRRFAAIASLRRR